MSSVSLAFSSSRSPRTIHSSRAIKRTAFLAALEMLKLNGYDFEAPNEEELGQIIEEAIEGIAEEDEFIETMKEFVVSSS